MPKSFVDILLKYFKILENRKGDVTDEKQAEIFSPASAVSSVSVHTGRLPLIGFFKLNSPDVIHDAKMYLIITCGAIVFSFLNQVFTGILAAMGNTMATFRATTIGLIINIVLDPLFIFGFGPVPRMEVTGAAIATVLAQIIVFLLYLVTVWNEPVIFKHIHLMQKTEKQHVREIDCSISLKSKTVSVPLIFSSITAL